ncbi:F-actin-capping protein subunit beta [Carpediemonas membranifera]|uniref:F-actin-capping protein subunit beta n=2 Tax=Carpediemonas membranifera TaxID=201153 RepID=A0A8J6E1Y9_9EUKA|nr:F-actin-capping protein subunit beta [Carpediemonas membranifera]|eukprot:KAG9396954.1 F-actin-capping protein subunit beta [Carpediemonas membranifera]
MTEDMQFVSQYGDYTGTKQVLTLFAVSLLPKIPELVGHLCSLCPDLTDDWLTSIDQPLQVKKCAKTGRDFVLCDYNRDADSYRSPFSNEYEPPLEDAVLPRTTSASSRLRANDIFATFTKLYYESGVCSVYAWDPATEDGAFAMGVFIHKVGEGHRGLDQGVWDSIHVFEVVPEGDKFAYRLTTTVLLSMNASGTGLKTLAGSYTQQAENNLKAGSGWHDHVVNMGKMVETMENQMRNSLQSVYFGKAKDVLGELRDAAGASQTQRMAALQSSLAAQLKARNAE